MANKTLHSIISEIINSVYLKVKEKLEDIKGVNGRRTQYNGNKEKVQNDKERSITLYTENNIEHHETHWVTRRAQVPRKGNQYIDDNKTIRYFYFTL